VKTYGIGGITGEPLSKYEAAVGFATALQSVNGIYALANMSSGIADLPYQGDLTFSVGELFAPGSTVPLSLIHLSTQLISDWTLILSMLVPERRYGPRSRRPLGTKNNQQDYTRT